MMMNLASCNLIRKEERFREKKKKDEQERTDSFAPDIDADQGKKEG